MMAPVAQFDLPSESRRGLPWISERVGLPAVPLSLPSSPKDRDAADHDRENARAGLPRSPEENVTRPGAAILNQGGSHEPMDDTQRSAGADGKRWVVVQLPKVDRSDMG